MDFIVFRKIYERSILARFGRPASQKNGKVRTKVRLVFGKPRELHFMQLVTEQFSDWMPPHRFAARLLL